MTDEGSTRIRTAVVAACGVAVVAAGAYWAGDAAERSREARFQVHLDRMQAEWAAMDFDREALWGETVDESAWPHLQRFAALAENDETNESLTPAALEALHRAAHARDARLPPGELDWVDEWWIHLDAIDWALTHVVLAAHTQDEQIAAFRSILDFQQVCCDVLLTPGQDKHNGAKLAVAMGNLVDQLDADQVDGLSHAAKHIWLEGVRRLERRIPAAPPGFSWIMDWSSMAPAERDAWLGAYDLDLTDLNGTIDDLERIRPEWEQLLGGAGPGLLDRASELEQSMGRDGEFLVGIAFGAPLADFTAEWIACRTRISFLRHALALHLGEPSSLDIDPFGTGIHIEHEGARVRVWTEYGVEGWRVEVAF